MVGLLYRSMLHMILCVTSLCVSELQNCDVLVVRRRGCVRLRIASGVMSTRSVSGSAVSRGDRPSAGSTTTQAERTRTKEEARMRLRER